MTYYDPESGKVYTDESAAYEAYSISSIQDNSIVREKTIENEDDYYYGWTICNGNEEFSIEETTRDEWESFKSGYEVGIDKYGLEGIELSEENVDKALGLSDDSTDSRQERSESIDSFLYSVEVTAPDGYVNFRKGTGTDFEIISPLSNGEVLPVYEEGSDGKWLKVEYQGNTGWVAASQVTKR